jgi:hypothetical protein
MQGFPKQTLGLMLIRFKRLAIDFLLSEKRPSHGFLLLKLVTTTHLLHCPEPAGKDFLPNREDPEVRRSIGKWLRIFPQFVSHE